MDNEQKLIMLGMLGLICAFGVLFVACCAPFIGLGQEQVDVQVIVLSKDVMPSEVGTPIYSVTLDTSEGAFVYSSYSPNGIDVYNSVSVGSNYTCSYYRYWLEDRGIKHSHIIKINGVSVE